MKSQAEPTESQHLPQAARTGDRPEARTEPAAAAQLSARLWTVAEAAGYLQISKHAIYRMTAPAAAVRIPHIRIGGKLRFRQADIDQWLTLLSVSNLGVLSKMRQKSQVTRHGNDSQTDSG
jgi:excisionase family DNA binding protein